MKAQYPGVIAFHVPNGGKRPKQTLSRKGKLYIASLEGRKMKEMGAKAGVSDWIILSPNGVFHGLVVELKTKGGTIQKTQIDFLSKCNETGYYACICWSIEGFVEILEWYFSLSKPANTDSVLDEMRHQLRRRNHNQVDQNDRTNGVHLTCKEARLIINMIEQW